MSKVSGLAVPSTGALMAAHLTIPLPLPKIASMDTNMTTAPAPAPSPMPDRLSTDPKSPHHIAAVFERDIGIRLNGKDRSDVPLRPAS